MKNHPRYGRGGKPLDFLPLFAHWGLLRLHFWPFRVLIRRKFHINRVQIVCSFGFALLQGFKINMFIRKNLLQGVLGCFIHSLPTIYLKYRTWKTCPKGLVLHPRQFQEQFGTTGCSSSVLAYILVILLIFSLGFLLQLLLPGKLLQPEYAGTLL